ncbi:MAG: hypothetical protein ACT4PT_06180 [Methanobacteriota archaeon]
MDPRRLASIGFLLVALHQAFFIPRSAAAGSEFEVARHPIGAAGLIVASSAVWRAEGSRAGLLVAAGLGANAALLVARILRDLALGADVTKYSFAFLVWCLGFVLATRPAVSWARTGDADAAIPGVRQGMLVVGAAYGLFLAFHLVDGAEFGVVLALLSGLAGVWLVAEAWAPERAAGASASTRSADS